jgi:ABC-2 type transport system ATP-binding protein
VQIIHQGQLILKESIGDLNQHMDTGSVLISTRLKPDLTILSALAGVLSIESMPDQHIKIAYRLTDNPTQRIIETIISSGWELQALTPIKRSMEDIFISLTQHND